MFTPKAVTAELPPLLVLTYTYFLQYTNGASYHIGLIKYQTALINGRPICGQRLNRCAASVKRGYVDNIVLH